MEIYIIYALFIQKKLNINLITTEIDCPRHEIKHFNLLIKDMPCIKLPNLVLKRTFSDI